MSVINKLKVFVTKVIFEFFNDKAKTYLSAGEYQLTFYPAGTFGHARGELCFATGKLLYDISESFK